MNNFIKKQVHSSRAGERQAVVGMSAFRKTAVTVFLMGWIMACLVGCKNNGSAIVIQGDTESKEITEPVGVDSGLQKDSQEDLSAERIEDTEPAMWYVHVCGQVAVPGVYALEEGSRVWDAVEAAGGLTEGAQSESVNLARLLMDGCKVTIPTKEQAEESAFLWFETGEKSYSSGETTEDGLVDLNRATVEELMTIPGIGQSRAEAILAYRKKHGTFQSIEEIMQVTGIKEGLFAAIREYITVGG